MSATALSARLSLFYLAIFSAIGIHLPFWPVWLRAQGLSAGEIGAVLAAAFLTKVVSNPLVGQAVDRHGRRRGPLMLLAAAALAAAGLYALADGFWPILAVTVLFGGAFAAMMPVGENLTMLNAHARGLDYGRIRLWGSLSFIAASVLGGMVVARAPADAILAMLLAGVAATLAATLALPDAATPPAKGRRARAGWFYRQPLFLLFLGASALIQTSHMVYYGFGTLHWQAAGHGGGVIGALWAEGVIAEVILFAFGTRVLARFGPVRLIALAGAAGLVRWTVLAATTALPALAAANWLHALTFGATHLGAMHFITRAAPAEVSARAQALYSAVTMGLAPGLAMLASGRLYEAFGGGAFLVTAALAGLGGALALALLRRWDGGALAPPASRC